MDLFIKSAACFLWVGPNEKLKVGEILCESTNQFLNAVIILHKHNVIKQCNYANSTSLALNTLVFYDFL